MVDSSGDLFVITGGVVIVIVVLVVSFLNSGMRNAGCMKAATNLRLIRIC